MHQPTQSIVAKMGNYRLGHTIGKGNFAIVKLAQHDVANVEVGCRLLHS